MRKLALAVALVIMAVTGFAQETTSAPPTPPAFQAGLNLGTDVLYDKNGWGTVDQNYMVNYTRLAFQPDISFGKFGIGLDLSIHFLMYPDADTPFYIYRGDWVPEENTLAGFLDTYLPKLMYVRYGQKGEDPLYAKLGSIPNMSLGNGFIMSEYSNMNFMPGKRIIGLEFGLDGALFKFPFVGMELATGNLARWDVMGGRLFARPFITTSIPIIKNSEVGLTIVADSNAYLYDAAKVVEADPIAVWGMDFTAPIIQSKVFPLAAFADMAFEPNNSFGAMLGVGGKLFSVINYGAQLRFLQEGFIPSYFDTGYDIYRSMKYDFMQTDASGNPLYAAWFASLGFGFLEEKIVFNARLDGPFAAAAAGSTNVADYPHFKAVATLVEGVVGGFSFDASYEKSNLGSENSFFEDFTTLNDSIIGMAINYQTGASMLTLAYNLRYDPTLTAKPLNERFVVTSSISASMKL